MSASSDPLIPKDFLRKFRQQLAGLKIMPVCRHFSRADIIRTLLVITLAIGSIAAFGITVGVAASDPPETDQPDVVQMLGPVSQDKDLRDLATIPPTKRDEAEPRLMRRPFPQISSFLADDPYQIMRQPLQPAAMPAPLITFPGISSAQSTCGCLPPDTNGDVGPDHYIQAVNSRIKILDKSGAELLAPTTFNSFFSTLAGTPCANSNDGDGIVFYDHQSHRWVVSDFAFTSFPGTSFYQCIGVSKTADPVAGGWWLYAMRTDPVNLTYLGDYPKFGIWPDAWYMSVNLFSNSTTFKGVRTYALDRNAMMNGQPANTIAFTITPANLGNAYSLLPATFRTGSPPPAGLPEYFMAINSGAAGVVETQVFTWRFHADFTTPTNSTFGIGAGHTPNGTTNVDGFVNAYTATTAILVPQNGTTQKLDTLGDKLMYPLVYQNLGGVESIYSAQTVNNNQNGTGPTAIRWHQFNVTGGTIPATPSQQQTFNNNADGSWRWMPSLNVDSHGNLAIGYTTSSATTEPSIRYAGRLAGDLQNTLAQGEAVMQDGGGHQTSTSGRWGDYSAMMLDPADACTFWHANEYYSATSSASWNTRIGLFQFPGCTAAASPTPTVSPTNTPTPTATATCTPANYEFTSGTNALIPGTIRIDGVGCDDCTIPLPSLPFPVSLYGTVYTAATAGSNGVLAFGTANNAFGATCLPVATANNQLMPFYRDQRTDCTGGCGIFTTTTGVAPDRVFTIEFRTIYFAETSTTPTLDYEVNLYESGSFDYTYGSMNPTATTGRISTIGVQRDPAFFRQFSCDTTGQAPPVSAGQRISWALAPCGTPTPTATATATPTGTATNTPTSTPTSTATATPAIVGNVDYAVIAKAVPEVSISGEGSPAVSAMTNSLGNYSLTGFGAGAYTITASKMAQPCPGGPPNGIFSNDAALIARHVVHLITLSPDQVIAGTVNGFNLPISSFDAALIAQKIVGVCSADNHTGEWTFTPPNIEHPGGVNGQIVENYRAVLLGDVSGDWDPLGLAAPGESFVTDTNAITVSVPVISAVSGSQILIPLRLDGLRERTVESLQFDISYDPAVITPGDPGATLQGAVDQGLSIVSNSPTPGLLKVAIYGAEPAGGDGVYAYLIFNVAGPARTASDLRISGFRFNDGRAAASLKHGQLSVIPTSTEPEAGVWQSVHRGWGRSSL